MSKAEYHVGCGVFSIYAGTLNKDKTMWTNKSDVKEEAVSAVAQYLLMNKIGFKFEYEGKRYKMTVEEIKVGDDSDGKTD